MLETDWVILSKSIMLRDFKKFKFCLRILLGRVVLKLTSVVKQTSCKYNAPLLFVCFQRKTRINWPIVLSTEDTK